MFTLKDEAEELTGDKISENIEASSFSRVVRDVEIDFSQDERVGIKFVREVSKGVVFDDRMQEIFDERMQEIF
ncbi:9323_t:CDS:2 [Racocetra fulgida]|uniref:9323_t:CDS:1 n=1 Tax=Racocetra fulgida TaxID=60492 RepID=A0A9N8YXS3_9GLOM|nr:9323_t:CDS:2 [Racocetra fulgida]